MSTGGLEQAEWSPCTYVPCIVLRVSRLPRGLPLRDEDERGAQRVDGCLPQQLIGVGDAAEDHPEKVAHVLRE